MKTRWCFVWCASACLLLALLLAVSGCGERSTQDPSVSAPTVPVTETPAVTPPPDETPVVSETTAPDVEDLASLMDAVAEELAEQPVLSWARDAGGLNHCDRLSVYADGRVEAVVCKGGVAELTRSTDLTEEQLQTVLTWAVEYTSFTRREMEMSGAVRATTLSGTGQNVPPFEVKVDIAAFAADVFFRLTEVR
jgi:hypothetical protein